MDGGGGGGGGVVRPRVPVSSITAFGQALGQAELQVRGQQSTTPSFFFFYTLLLSSFFWTSRGHIQVSSLLSPPVLAFNFYRA